MTHNDASFEEWMAKVDSILMNITAGFKSDDLPDFCYEDYYADGLTAREAAEDAISWSEGF